jgi:aqualysin 1
MNKIRVALLATSLLVVAACADRPEKPLLPTEAALSRSSDDRGPGPIPGQYIVVLHEGASPRSVSQMADVKPNFVYETVINGFAAQLTPEQLRELQDDPSVRYIAQDAVITTGQKAPSPFGAPEGSIDPSVIQAGATWGIDRTDQRNLPLNGTYRYHQTGATVNAYVVDTGIRTTHAQFGGRAFAGFSGFDAFGGTGQDCNGHGTHVAGTIGASIHGIAKQVRLVSVRVLDCNGNGTWGGFIAGLDWIANRHTKPAVANASLWGPVNAAADEAVARLVAYGVTFVGIAGNANGASACNYSPGRAPQSITVGATTSTDARAAFSNVGTCMHIFAPGQSITSTWHTSNTATSTQNGTSMAAPHVAGMAALFLQRHPTAAPALVRDVLISTATTGLVTNPGAGSPNRLLNRWNNRIATQGASRFEPHGGSYSAAAGWHHGWLSGSASNFNLYLQRWVCSPTCAWTTVASSLSFSSNEYIVYNGPAGTYRWRVHAYTGSGDYDLFVRKP